MPVHDVPRTQDATADGVSDPTTPRPLVLVRGFGGLDVRDEQHNAYQGFNDGTVYPHKRGDNFIYEGFVLRAMKSQRYRYTDATNVVGYYGKDIGGPDDAGGYEPGYVRGTVALDPRTANLVLRDAAPGTIWIYRYYDLNPRTLVTYGKGLARLVHLIDHALDKQRRDRAEALGRPLRPGEKQAFLGVDIVAHSMGGLVVRQALKELDAEDRGSARELVHKIVTLGTPHRGIAFQGFPKWLLAALPGVAKSADELDAFDPDSTAFLQIEDWFDLDRILTVVGTSYRTYNTGAASWANRLSSLADEGTLSTNRSDGLVKHSAAQLPGAPRTFVDKCHGGPDSLVTSREAYEIAMRFFHGTHRVSLWLDDAHVTRGKDLFGKSEFYFGVSIRPRNVDFDLFVQSRDAENCYGPFHDEHLADKLPDLATELRKPFSAEGDVTTGWAGEHRLIWQGWVDAKAAPDPDDPEMVFRLDVSLSERDSYGIGFSDNVVFAKQYFVQVIPGSQPGDRMEILLHTGEGHLTTRPGLSREALVELARQNAAAFARDPGAFPDVQAATRAGDDWTFPVGGTGFRARLRIGVAEA